jgi:hypothetical protein
MSVSEMTGVDGVLVISHPDREKAGSWWFITWLAAVSRQTGAGLFLEGAHYPPPQYRA